MRQGKRVSVTIDQGMEISLRTMQRKLGIGTLARTVSACIRVVSSAFAHRGADAPYDSGYGLTDEVAAMFRHYANHEIQPHDTPPARRRKDNGFAILYGSTDEPTESRAIDIDIDTNITEAQDDEAQDDEAQDDEAQDDET